MPNISLPPRNPTTLRSFWIIVSTASGLIIGTALSSARKDPRLLLASLPTAACIGAPGLARPQLVVHPYRVWDKLGRLANTRARQWLTTLGFAALLASRSLGEIAAVPSGSPGISGWSPKHTQPATTYPYQDHRGDPRNANDGFARFAEHHGNGWVEALRPPLRLLAAMEMDREEDATPPSDIYTLY